MMNIESNRQTLSTPSLFQTSDTGLSATLSALGFPVIALDSTNPNRVQFVFSREDGLDEAIQSFWAKELQIEPQLLLIHYRELKNRLHAGY